MVKYLSHNVKHNLQADPVEPQRGIGPAKKPSNAERAARVNERKRGFPHPIDHLGKKAVLPGDCRAWLGRKDPDLARPDTNGKMRQSHIIWHKNTFTNLRNSRPGNSRGCYKAHTRNTLSRNAKNPFKQRELNIPENSRKQPVSDTERRMLAQRGKISFLISTISFLPGNPSPSPSPF